MDFIIYFKISNDCHVVLTAHVTIYVQQPLEGPGYILYKEEHTFDRTGTIALINISRKVAILRASKSIDVLARTVFAAAMLNSCDERDLFRLSYRNYSIRELTCHYS